MYATTYEFVESQIMELGFDFVEDLVNRGFVPYLTDSRGFRWVYAKPVNHERQSYVIDSRD